MQAHYTRRPHAEGRLTDAVQSLVYQVVQPDELTSAGRIFELASARAAKEGDPAPTRKAVEAALRGLVTEKLVHEIHGARLSRLLAT